jgi:RimJ/RimL family protein N-acetyltransferase
MTLTPALRPATADDCPAIAGWLNDPAVNAMLSANLREVGLTAQALALGLRRRDQSWFVFSVADAAPAGLIAVDSIDRGDGVGNLWFLLGDRLQAGRGLTSAAIDAFCRGNPAQLHVATAWIVDGNAASVRCLEKAGFRPAGRIVEGVNWQGGRRDRILMQRILGV